MEKVHWKDFAKANLPGSLLRGFDDDSGAGK